MRPWNMNWEAGSEYWGRVRVSVRVRVKVRV